MRLFQKILIVVKEQFQLIFFNILKIFILKEKSGIKNSIAFFNLSQLGDVVVSSMIFENDDLFSNVDVYFVINSKYKSLFEGYKGRINIIGINLNLYKWCLIYKIKFLLYLRSLNIQNTYNLSPGRGYINDELSLLSNSRNVYSTTIDSYYQNNKVREYFNNRYKTILFENIFNEYYKHAKLIDFYGGNKTFKVGFNKSFNIYNSKYKEYILISPFSTNTLKDWGINKYKILCQRLSIKNDIIITGSKNSMEKLKEIKGNNPRININVDNLNRIPTLVYYASLFIGNDSGISHIAFKMKKKMLLILTGAFYGKYFPLEGFLNVAYVYEKMECFNCKLKCIFDTPKCIYNITVDEVLLKVHKLLH